MRADLRLELPQGRSGSLVAWLAGAAVVAEARADGVLVRARANRVFRPADLVAVVREWMQSWDVDAVLADSGGSLFAIVPVVEEARR
jgi:hypothetical protein